MALIHCNYSSSVIGYASKMVVILPQAAQNQIGVKNPEQTSGEKFKTLYLLHGLSDDESIWTRRTSIERYASEMNLAVVMPTTHRSWYTDADKGYKYYTHIAHEVPEIARSFFPLSDKREDNFIAGLSMGGYGALKIALRNPDKFAAAASLSGALDICAVYDVLGENVRDEFINIFGSLDSLAGSDNDLFAQADKLAATPEEAPALYQCCGTEDFLYQMNIKFRDSMQGTKFDYTYAEAPGAHNWQFWDDHIKDVLSWLPMKN